MTVQFIDSKNRNLLGETDLNVFETYEKKEAKCGNKKVYCEVKFHGSYAQITFTEVGVL